MHGRSIRARLKALRRSVEDVAGWAWKCRAETALSCALVGGWLLVTYGIAGLIRPRIAWPISVGLLLLTASGWKFIAKIAAVGLYAMQRAALGRG